MSIQEASSASLPSNVTIIDIKVINCANPKILESFGSTMRLGPIDQLVLPFVPMSVVFVYEQATSGSELIPISILEKAMSLLMDYYPHLTGRIQVNPVDKSPEVGHIGTGAELLSATCLAPLDAFRSSNGRYIITDLPDGGNALLVSYIPDFDVICQWPVLSIQHTRFACGSVTLGVRLPHILCDSYGFFQFMRDLAELYRGISVTGGSSVVKLSVPPEINCFFSELHTMPEQEKQEALKYKPWLYQLDKPTEDVVDPPVADTASLQNSSPITPSTIGRVLRFSPTELDAIKSAATDLTSDGFISTFDALAAHLCQRVFLARIQYTKESGASLESVSSGFLAPVNWRGPEHLNLSSRYFANAALAIFSDIPREILLNGPTSEIAKSVHNIVRLPNKPDVMDTLRWVAVQPDKSKVKPGFRIDRSIFMVSQWCKFGMYVGMDMGSPDRPIDPVLVSPPFTVISLVDGLTYFCATEEQLDQDKSSTSRMIGSANSQSIDVNMALLEPLWKILDQDKEFCKYLPSP